jgi:hypothetical protein
MFALKDGAEDGEDGHENNGVPESDEPAPHCGADAVGRVVGADVPADIDPGTDENKENRFYGLSPLRIIVTWLSDGSTWRFVFPLIRARWYALVGTRWICRIISIQSISQTNK